MERISAVLLLLYAVVLPLFVPVSSMAQPGVVQPTDEYRYYDINKIHSNEVIKGISKDDEGFLWLASDQGVLRFDGNETVLFYKDFSSPYTKKFLKRKNGQMLILTDYGIREIVQDQDTTFFRPLLVGGKPFLESLNYPKSIFEDKEGNVWIGEGNAVIKITDTEFKRYFLGPKYQSINYHRSFSFAEDAFGHIWIAPYNGRLLSYNKAADRLEDVAIPYPLTEVTFITTLKGDHLLIGGKEGVLQLKIDSGKNVLENEFVGGPNNISTAALISDVLYVGTWENGLFYANTLKKPFSFEKVDQLSFKDVLDFYHDQQLGEIWITGSENIGLLKPSVIRPVGAVGDYRVESLSFDSTGILYYSTGQQLFKLAPGQGEKARQLISSTSTYFNRVLAEEDKLWIGEAFGRISYFDLSKNSLHLVRDSIYGNSAVTDIMKDQAGNKWFAGLRELVRINTEGALKGYPEVAGSIVLGQNDRGQLFSGASGRDSFLYLYDQQKDTFQSLKVSFDFPASAGILVNDIAFDSLGNPWLATNEGLLQIKNEKGEYQAERVNLKGIDIDEPLTSIAIVGDQLWLAYSYALASYYQGQVVLYTRENGLPSRVLKERSFNVHDGKLYVATAKGLALIDVQQLNNRSTPLPLLKGVLINGEKFSISGQKQVEFPYGARVQFDFASLTYPGNNVVYQTRLKGVEESWSEPSANSSMSIFGFNKGTYTLQVRARDTGYLWSEPMEFTFSVAAPWYTTWWAILLFVLAGVGLILAAVKIYHFHLIRQKSKLQQVIEERTREINQQKNEIIEQKNKLIQQKEELIEKNNAVYKSQKALTEADLNFMHLKEKQLQDQIEYRNKQITTHTLNIIQKNEMMQALRDQLEGVIKSSNGSTHNELKKMLKLIDESYRLDKDWEEFKLYFEQIYTGFYAKLKVNYPDLTNQELRHCALIRLNLSNAECASLLGISPGSIKVTRTRLRKKLNLENHQSLTDLLMGL